MKFKEVKLKYFCEIKDGTHDTPRYVEKNQESIPFVTSKDIIDGDIDFTDTKYISPEDHERFSRRSNVQKGDVLMPMIGTVGNPTLVKTDKEFSIKNVALFKTCNDKVKARYLYYLLDSEYMSRQLKKMKSGGVQSFVSLSILKNLKINLPLNIASTVNYLELKINEINSLISDKKHLIELLEEKRQAIITETVTKGLNPNVKMKDSGIEWIGEIPEHWTVIRIKYVTELVTKKSKKELPYLGLEHVESNTGKIRELKVQKSITGESLEFQKFDVLFGKLRPYLKKCIVAPKLGQCTSEFFVIRTDNKSINPFYLKNIMLSNGFIEFINSTTYGAKMPRANWDTVGNIKIPIPDLEEQKNIENNIKEIESIYKNLIAKQKNIIEKLKEYRESLIYEAVTGKIDLRNF